MDRMAKITEAAERARVMIQDLQSRLRVDPPAEDSTEDLEKQLQQYFETAGAGAPSLLSEIRNRVIEGVVERILREWEKPQHGEASAIENEVVTRLIDRVLERLS
jgi:hypothetical protein